MMAKSGETPQREIAINGDPSLGANKPFGVSGLRPPKNARSFYFLAVLAVIQTSIANFLPSNGGADILGCSDTGCYGSFSSIDNRLTITPTIH